MIKKIVLTLTTLLIVTLVIIIQKKNSQIDSLEQDRKVYSETIQKQGYIEQKLVFNNYITSTNLGNKTFEKDLFLNEDGKEFNIEDLKTKSHNQLFFRYSSISCNTCTEQSLEILKSFEIPVVIIANYDNKTYLNTFKRMNQINQEIYSPASNLFEFDTLAYPYFFVLNEKNKIIDFNLPILDDMSLTEEFLFRQFQRLK